MVKFGKYLASHQVPEWSSQYVRYKRLKKILKQIRAQRDERDEQQEQEEQQQQQRQRAGSRARDGEGDERTRVGRQRPGDPEEERHSDSHGSDDDDDADDSHDEHSDANHEPHAHRAAHILHDLEAQRSPPMRSPPHSPLRPPPSRALSASPARPPPSPRPNAVPLAPPLLPWTLFSPPPRRRAAPGRAAAELRTGAEWIARSRAAVAERERAVSQQAETQANGMRARRLSMTHISGLAGTNPSVVDVDRLSGPTAAAVATATPRSPRSRAGSLPDITVARASLATGKPAGTLTAAPSPTSTARTIAASALQLPAAAATGSSDLPDAPSQDPPRDRSRVFSPASRAGISSVRSRTPPPRSRSRSHLRGATRRRTRSLTPDAPSALPKFSAALAATGRFAFSEEELHRDEPDDQKALDYALNEGKKHPIDALLVEEDPHVRPLSSYIPAHVRHSFLRAEHDFFQLLEEDLMTANHFFLKQEEFFLDKINVIVEQLDRLIREEEEHAAAQAAQAEAEAEAAAEADARRGKKWFQTGKNKRKTSGDAAAHTQTAAASSGGGAASVSPDHIQRIVANAKRREEAGGDRLRSPGLNELEAQFHAEQMAQQKQKEKQRQGSSRSPSHRAAAAPLVSFADRLDSLRRLDELGWGADADADAVAVGSPGVEEAAAGRRELERQGAALGNGGLGRSTSKGNVANRSASRHLHTLPISSPVSAVSAPIFHADETDMSASERSARRRSNRPLPPPPPPLPPSVPAPRAASAAAAAAFIAASGSSSPAQTRLSPRSAGAGHDFPPTLLPASAQHPDVLALRPRPLSDVILVDGDATGSSAGIGSSGLQMAGLGADAPAAADDGNQRCDEDAEDDTEEDDAEDDDDDDADADEGAELVSHSPNARGIAPQPSHDEHGSRSDSRSHRSRRGAAAHDRSNTHTSSNSPNSPSDLNAERRPLQSTAGSATAPGPGGGLPGAAPASGTPGTGMVLAPPSLAQRMHLNLKFRLMTAQKPWKVLEKALVELYRGLHLLRNYKILNFTAFVKILKKYDKLALHASEGFRASDVLLPRIQSTHFLASPILKAFIRRVELIFAQTFTGGNHKAALEGLRAVQAPLSSWETFRLGMMLGACSILLLLLIVVSVWVDNINEDYSVILHLSANLPIWRGLALIILHLWGWGVNVYLFHKYRVNHEFIFEINPRTELQFQQVLTLAATLSAIWFFLIDVYLFVDLARSSDVWSAAVPGGVACAAFVGMLALALCPFDVLYRPTRWYILRTLGTIVAAPFYSVAFKDFYIADQLTSLVNVFNDVAYSACHITTGSVFISDRVSDPTCLTVQTNAVWVLAFLPHWWRLLQCFRKYSDDPVHNRRQLLNAAKYASSMMTTLMSLLYKNVTPTFLGVWIGVATFSTLFSFSWDIIQDWGLVRFDADSWKPKLFPRRLLIKSHKPYYAAIFTNFLLRIAWVFTISPTRFGIDMPKDYFNSVVWSLEIVRRNMWNYFRLENEHLTNCENYRVVNIVPLPMDGATPAASPDPPTPPPQHRRHHHTHGEDKDANGASSLKRTASVLRLDSVSPDPAGPPSRPLLSRMRSGSKTNARTHYDRHPPQFDSANLTAPDARVLDPDRHDDPDRHEVTFRCTLNGGAGGGASPDPSPDSEGDPAQRALGEALKMHLSAAPIDTHVAVALDRAHSSSRAGTFLSPLSVITSSHPITHYDSAVSPLEADLQQVVNGPHYVNPNVQHKQTLAAQEKILHMSSATQSQRTLEPAAASSSSSSRPRQHSSSSISGGDGGNGVVPAEEGQAPAASLPPSASAIELSTLKRAPPADAPGVPASASLLQLYGSGDGRGAVQSPETPDFGVPIAASAPPVPPLGTSLVPSVPPFFSPLSASSSSSSSIAAATPAVSSLARPPSLNRTDSVLHSARRLTRTLTDATQVDDDDEQMHTQHFGLSAHERAALSPTTVATVTAAVEAAMATNRAAAAGAGVSGANGVSSALSSTPSPSPASTSSSVPPPPMISRLSSSDLRLQHRALQDLAADDLLDTVLAHRRSMAALPVAVVALTNANAGLTESNSASSSDERTTHGRSNSRDGPQLTESHSRRRLAALDASAAASAPANPRAHTDEPTPHVELAVTHEGEEGEEEEGERR